MSRNAEFLAEFFFENDAPSLCYAPLRALWRARNLKVTFDRGPAGAADDALGRCTANAWRGPGRPKPRVASRSRADTPPAAAGGECGATRRLLSTSPSNQPFAFRSTPHCHRRMHLYTQPIWLCSARGVRRCGRLSSSTAVLTPHLHLLCCCPGGATDEVPWRLLRSSNPRLRYVAVASKHFEARRM